MRIAVSVLLLCACASMVGACSDGGARDKVTVVLEADRARAQEEQARLVEMQRALSDAKRDLVDARADLTDLRERLLKTGALTADESKRLQDREEKLAATERALPSNAAPGAAPGTLTRADVEELLRAQEERLRAACAPSTTAAAPVAAAAGAPDEIASLQAAAAKLRGERGLRPDDVPEGERLARRIDDGLRTHRPDDALAAARALVDATNKVTVDAGLIRKKYDRANAGLADPKLSPERRLEVQRLLKDAVHEKGVGNLAAANEKLNAALDRL